MKRFMRIDAVTYDAKPYSFHKDMDAIDEITVSNEEDGDLPEGTISIHMRGYRYDRSFIFRGTEEEFMNKVAQHLAAVVVPVARVTNVGR